MAKKASKSAGSTYTKPQLREKLKQEVKAEDKGGKPGQWSARKSQLLAQKYKAAGGGYEGEKGAPQKSLDAWTDEAWTTSDGKRARKKTTTDRYLPAKAWDAMSDAQKEATKKKKQAASKEGKQFVANTDEARASRKKVSKKAGQKKVTKKAAATPKATKKSGVTKKKASSKSTTDKRAPARSSKKTAKKTGKKTAKKKTTAKKTTKKAARSSR